MSAIKPIAITVIHFFLFMVCLGQRETIDSLRKLLPSLSDSARVDCLNNISEAYIGLPDWFNPAPGQFQMDTAEKVVINALYEATEINYVYGMARATSLKAELAFEKDNNYIEAERLSRQAIELYKKASRKIGINRSYWRLGTALHSQSVFDAAVKNYDTCYTLSKELGDSLYIFYSIITAATVLNEKGDYKSSFERGLILHQLITVTSDPQRKFNELDILGSIYFALEDYSTALRYFQQGYDLIGPDYKMLALTFALNKQTDSAKKYFNLVKPDTSDQKSLRLYLEFVGKYHLSVGEYDKAVPDLLRGLFYNREVNDVNKIMGLLMDLSKTYFALQKRDAAFKYGREAFALASTTGAKQIQRDAAEILSLIYDDWNRADSAYFYYKQYTRIKDIVVNDHLKGKLSGLAFEQKIELLNKEKVVQQVRLQKESLQKKILIGGVVIFLFIAFLLWRNNRHKQRDYVLLQQQKQKTDNQKAKAETALQELKTTQSQLVQKEKMASLGELTAGIAHEIQNPLNFVNNFSEVNKELLAEMKEEMDRGNFIEAKAIADDLESNEKKIHHHGKRADAIVKSMLQHSQSTEGQKEPIDINKITDEYLKLSSHGLRSKENIFNVVIKTDFDESIGTINIVPQDIGRVLLNLYNNAFYAVNEKKKQSGFDYIPTVSVTTRKSSGNVEINVLDNGNGVPQNLKDKIFQPFFTTKPTGEGTGLGLSLAYDIVKANGGEIKLETRVGEFSLFSVILPA